MSAETNYTEATPVTPSAAPSTPLWKDLLIPGSIIIAGIAIGAGLYFNGGTGPSGGGSDTVAVSGGQQPTLEQRVNSLVEAAGVDSDDFAECVASGDMDSRVQEDIDNALATGGGGTPWSIVIGADGKTYPLNGALPAQAVQQIIDVARNGGEGPTGGDGVDTSLVNPITDADHIKGPRNAAVTVIEYSDFDCPFCSRFHATMDQVASANDDVAWVYRHFPLAQLHPNARSIAIASECVAELGGNEAFWTFADGYFASS